MHHYKKNGDDRVDRRMNKVRAGYVAFTSGALLVFSAFASAGDPPPSQSVSDELNGLAPVAKTEAATGVASESTRAEAVPLVTLPQEPQERDHKSQLVLGDARAAAKPAETHKRADGGLKDVAGEAAGAESTGLPYALVLALLALIGLVPVARRNNHRQV